MSERGQRAGRRCCHPCLRHERNIMRNPIRWLAVAGTLIAAAAGVAVPAHAATSSTYVPPPIHVKVLPPSENGRAGANGLFNVDLSLRARTSAANALLSRAAGYKPFSNAPGSATFGPGMPDPGAPG